MEQEKQKLRVDLGDAESEGIYSNLALITHSPSEFIFDFARVLPGRPTAKVYARVIMTPMHAKSFMTVLQKNLEAHEKKYGPIKSIGEDDKNKAIGF